jgi:hypothetical protein
MKERIFKTSMLAVLIGCATMNDVVKAKSEGEHRLYPVTCDQAYDIAQTVFRNEGVDAIEDHRAEGYMLTSSGASGFTWGTFMGAWTESAKPGHCLVTVVTKRKMKADAVTTLTESTFHERFTQAVAATRPVAVPVSVNEGCAKDTDCKGSRICVHGVCGDPGGE